ncbi:MAG: heparinase [Ruminococcaceae bacterium]|nr:heparinase [Oscillospiraceae bacterium]
MFTDFLNRYRRQFVNAGKELDGEKIPPLTEDLFSLFERTGNRLEYENVYFKRRKFLTVYAMLSIMYGAPSHISRLEEIIGSVCGEECWALPAHVDRNNKDWRITIDLFSAETAFSLAEIICLLKDRLSDGLQKQVRKEVFGRVIGPFEKSHFPYSSWEISPMNWCAVCCGSIGGAAIYLMKDDRERLDKLLTRINGSIANYIKGFGEDGACLEGLGYYTYGMSFFAAYAELMYGYSEGKVDLFEYPKLKNIALFQQKCFLTGDITISFSDSQRDEKYRLGLTAYLSRRFSEVEIPPLSLAADMEADNCYRYIVLSRDYFWTKQNVQIAASQKERNTVLPYAQWSVCRSDNGCVLAAKGGHNDEPHNHNDIGSFIYACEGESVLADVGAGEYTRDYFNENRYKNICCRSLGHSVPLIDGKEQLAGARHKASRFISDGCGKTEMDIGAAYGLSPGNEITRAFSFEKNSGICTVTDLFKLKDKSNITENLVTLYKPLISGSAFFIKTPKNQFIIEITGGKRLRVINENYTDHYGAEKTLWLMQWEVSGECAEFVIKRRDNVK